MANSRTAASPSVKHDRGRQKLISMYSLTPKRPMRMFTQLSGTPIPMMIFSLSASLEPSSDMHNKTNRISCQYQENEL